MGGRNVGKVKKIIVHCSASDWGTGIIINKWHTDPKPLGRGWSSIGYHAVIENGYPTGDHYKRGYRLRLFNGMISNGRPYDADEHLLGSEIGAHAYGFNKESLGVCLVGDEKFTKQQVINLIKLLRLWEIVFRLDFSPDNLGNIVLGHGELPGVSKSCPNLDMDIIRRLVLNKKESFETLRAFHNVTEV